MARAAMESWRRQTGPWSELVIVDDGDDPSFPDAQDSFCGYRISYVQLQSRLTVGAKRNLACQVARGEYIVHFDSDDWSAPGRIANQVERLMRDRACQVTGYHALLFRQAPGLMVVEGGGVRPAREWWRYRDRHGLAAGTSLCYRRTWWEGHPFADHNLNQDDLFYAEAEARGVACAVDAGKLMWARNHAGNVSGRVIGGDEWEELYEGLD